MSEVNHKSNGLNWYIISWLIILLAMIQPSHLRRVLLAGAIAATTTLASTNEPTTTAGPIFSLDQFGPVRSVTEAEATFQKASADIIAAGGGVILIPTNAPPGWQPKNNSQEELRIPAPPAPAKSWRAAPGVTVVDARGGTVKIQPPQATGIQIDRTLNIPAGQSLPFWDYYPVLKLRNTVLQGSTSYREWLLEDAPAGNDSKFYVATIRGVFPGMFMSIGEWGTVERLYVKSIGYDTEKKLWYFTADTVAGQRKGTIMGNKNHVNVLDMLTSSHNENQTFDVRMWRHNYSQGDNYLFDARFKYMGDVHSTAGDENGVLYAAFIESLTDIFRAQVEKWDAATGELVFKGSAGTTLGTGRPLINMNPAKWLTNGAVRIGNLPPGGGASTRRIPAMNTGRTIRFTAEAGITAAVAGRYFAVDEPDEMVMKTKDVRRWYLIESVALHPDGTADIRIIRQWWGAKSADAPLLYKPESYTKPLRYIIAPGANVFNVAEGVNHPNRTIKLVPTPVTGTSLDFAAGDKVEQAIGPDPFKPVPFRSWMWDQIPGAFPAPVFDIANYGVMRDALFWVRGNSTGNHVTDRERNYDRNPPWDKYFRLDSACNIGIHFGGDTANAALLFSQPHHVQPIKWQYGGGKTASLIVSRETGEFNFSGPISVTGLSADGKTPARNLRGKDVAIAAGQTIKTITFATPEADASYAVFVEQTWLSVRAITKKDAQGFTVEFEKPAPANATLDWMIVR
ncbi:MAG: hypothetical protein PCFJNLEI_02740 [Verrucomicrobiae bacterium]|nr:hypothetical protein [Verrucomicrobiae bacterium]